MEYRFIHHWQYEPGEQENRILEAAITLLDKERTDNFLAEIATFISIHTNSEYVSIGIIAEDAQHIHTCVFLQGRHLHPNITYSLKGTPCDAVITQRFCYFPIKVADNFPTDKELQDLKIESYLGSIFLSGKNEPLGLIALMDLKPIENAAFAEHLILVLSPAIEEELAKRKLMGLHA